MNMDVQKTLKYLPSMLLLLLWGGFLTSFVMFSIFWVNYKEATFKEIAYEKFFSEFSAEKKSLVPKSWLFDEKKQVCVQSSEMSLCPKGSLQIEKKANGVLYISVNNAKLFDSRIAIAFPSLDEKGLLVAFEESFEDEAKAAKKDTALLLATLFLIGASFSSLLSALHIRACRNIQYMDRLTGLGTRTLALRKMMTAGKLYKAGGWLVINIKQMRQITAAYGHDTTDRLIVSISKRLVSLPYSGTRLFRLDGAAFAYLLLFDEKTNDYEARASDAAQEAVSLLSPHYVINGHELSIDLALGVCVSSELDYAHAILSRAEAAVEASKKKGTKNPVFFDESMELMALSRIEMISAIKQALSNQEFRVYFQPLVDAKTKHPMGAEALIRWKPNSSKTISPEQFVPLLEETGLIIPVGAYVLRESCKQAQIWRTKISESLSVSVNISAKQFQDPFLPDMIESALAHSGLPPKHLILEITETSVVDDPEGAAVVIENLRSKGVLVAIDDFGVGYSSLSVFSKMPFDILKIDKTFVQDEESGRNIASAIASLAIGLGMQCVAEGVETEEQAAYCSDLGCSKLQGYFFSPPMESSKAYKWFEAAFTKKTSVSELD